MSFLLYLSDLIVPLMILGIVTYGLTMGVNVYDEFVKGAKKGFGTVLKIMPTLIGLMVAVGILRASGFLELVAYLIGKLTVYIGFPAELVPLTIVKMFSLPTTKSSITKEAISVFSLKTLTLIFLPLSVPLLTTVSVNVLFTPA